MKKVLTLCVAVAASLFITNTTQAQVKIGFFDEQAVLALMPGIGKVDTALQIFAADSLASERNSLMEDLSRLDSLLKDTAKLTSSLKTVLQKEASQKYYKLQNWQQYQQEVLQGKQEELLRPYRQQVYTVLENVIKEQKYTIVLKPTDVIHADNLNDIPLRVLAGLKIALPKEVSEAIKAAGISTGTGPAQPASKPALPPGAKQVKPAGKN
ncbi:MAG: OmpH family outer membrane protein [Chitinophagaceae bacterium]